jgi:hypothetical protein
MDFLSRLSLRLDEVFVTVPSTIVSGNWWRIYGALANKAVHPLFEAEKS